MQNNKSPKTIGQHLQDHLDREAAKNEKLRGITVGDIIVACCLGLALWLGVYNTLVKWGWVL